MAIDFEIPAEAKVLRERVRQWVQDECIPAEKRLLDGDDYKTVLGELRTKARGQGLWCPFIPEEYGGMGLGPLANALVQMELGQKVELGMSAMGSWAPIKQWASVLYFWILIMEARGFLNGDLGTDGHLGPFGDLVSFP